MFLSEEIDSEFNDIVSCLNVILHNQYTFPNESLRYIAQQPSWNSLQSELDEECKKLKSQLDNANVEVSCLQKELHDVRKRVDFQKKEHNKYENEVVRYSNLFDEIRNYISKYDPKLNLSEETKQKLSIVGKGLESLNEEYYSFQDQKGNVCNTSGSSNLSDESSSKTEDDLTDSRLLQMKDTKKHSCCVNEVVSMKRRKGNILSFSTNAPLAEAESSESLESDSSSTENEDDMNPVLKKLSSKQHCFVPKIVYKTAERCLPCSEPIGFGQKVLKCMECKAFVHRECGDQLVLPCLQMGVPRKRGMVIGSLYDYASQNSPMIPAIVVHCVNEVEKRGLNEIGLYRISGVKSEVKALKETFLKCKGVPNLADHDISVVCCCLKDFLRSLEDPLIPKFQRSLFVKALTLDNKTEIIRQLVSKLPPIHRDTLSFLVLHLKRVAQSRVCQMSKSNLAKVFGPTVVGYSSDCVLTTTFDVQAANSIMQELLSLPKNFWNCVIARDTHVPHEHIASDDLGLFHC